MTRALLLVPLAVGALACNQSGPLADLDGGWTISPSAQPGAATAPSAAAPPDAGRRMPPRPVPTSSPTVRITMPMDVQLQAIQYMAAMQAPQPDDARADPAYAQTIATGLDSVGKTEVVSSGRLIDVDLSKGCGRDAAEGVRVARHTGASLTTLLAHAECSLSAARTTSSSACRAHATRTTCSACTGRANAALGLHRRAAATSCGRTRANLFIPVLPSSSL